ncbi:general secretion pathway protein L [Vibrio orientalis CIP 102891 = ATCC 33934]|uniref:Type II secretion system protein L n=1 Tax=Vibrio orientalis CIP 102891 = ATCC 33934 TaxID=675816 RepID=C9QDL7_VIBOR|nr:type II secretion system protein GspL [Vibrio orientalis]EEX95119.1 general secretion pathway protein L [Vibrio orientalis CIP 102891 = ATCC 33934]EGU52182.1 general secretion pathway protein L [Vibrio orientalis CIP 102891 = ATCC 33934]
MNEFLIVRLSNNTAQAIQWIVWSESQQEVIASGELLGRSALPELANYSQGRRTLVLISAQSLVLTDVEIPAGASRQFESMLPYVLEDDLAQDVDQLHFSVLNKGQGRAQVCAIDRAFFEQLLSDLREQGCQIHQVMPDVLALPDVDGMSAVELDGQWLLKKSPYSGMAVESDWLALIAQSDWVKNDDGLLPLTAYSALPNIELAEEQQWQNGEPKLVMQLLAEQTLASKINLLTGAFKPKSSFSRHWKTWQKVAIAAVLLLAVVVVDNVLKVQRYEAQAAAYRAESERIFRQSLPGKSKIPTVSYLKREMNREAERLSGGADSSALLSLMVKLPPLLKQVPELTLTSFKYDEGRNEVRLQAQSKDFQTFEKAAQLLGDRFTVEQGQLNRSGGNVNGSFVLKPL